MNSQSELWQIFFCVLACGSALISLIERTNKLREALFYMSAGLFCLVLVLAPVVSWSLARDEGTVVDSRLRWCVVTQSPAVKGLKISEENLGWAVRRLKAGENWVVDQRHVIGKYAWAELGADKILREEDFAEFAPVSVPTGGAVVPVEVKTEHASHLKPGMQLAFAQEKEKTTLLLPAEKPRTGKRSVGNQPSMGFKLLAITVSAKDASVTTLTVAIEKPDLAAVQPLASGQWRPVLRH